ncbi:MAG TPA: LysR family transcriptional regulator [Flavobacterium sp.]|uniref:LysR family transcriptional regulator n=1 Tax=Flavobacterium sp. TaxID=239 RepID=UPI002DB7626A|nr:LysR family transcriptional regulator [Flavobacterium sp.]HEU4790730.1 LysR family transcriptional regulator [Flavobacterium sp.]
MELRKFKSFLVVAKELHFGKAAQKLNITQPALTHQIKNLESELGFDLFDKDKRANNRKVQLTEAGIYLIKEITRVIDQLDKTIQDARSISEKRKEFRIGIHKLSSNGFFEILQKLQKNFPGATFKIIEFSSLNLIQEAIFKDEVDFGLTLLPIIFKNLNYHIIDKDYLNLVMSVEHPLAKYKQIKLEQFRNDKWVTISKELIPSFLDDLEMSCRNLGFSREANIVQEVSNIDLLLGLVDSKVGVAILPSKYPINTDRIVSKELFISDNKKKEIIAAFVFKDTFDKEFEKKIIASL